MAEKKLFASLQQHLAAEDWEGAEKVSARILKEIPDDDDAAMSRWAALSQLGRHKDAQALCVGEFARVHRLECAYTKYKLRQYEAAQADLDACDKGRVESAMGQELSALVAFALGRYETAAGIYRLLVDGAKRDSTEHAVNLLAVEGLVPDGGAAARATAGRHVKAREELYEFAFNASVALACAGLYDEAAREVGEAEALALRQLDDEGVGGAEAETEIAPLRAQRAYLAHRSGRSSEARELYERVLAAAPSEALRAVAECNMGLLQRENTHEAEKKIRAAVTRADVLTPAQVRGILVNHCVLLQCMNRPKRAQEASAALQRRYPGDSLAAVLDAGLRARSKDLDGAEKTLRAAVADAAPGESRTLVVLALAQVLLARADPAAALTLLRASKPSLLSRLGVLAACVALAEACDADVGPVFDETADAAPDDDARAAVRASQGSYLARRGRHADAIKAFDMVLELRPSDPAALSGRLLSACECDHDLALRLGADLPDVRVEDGVSVETLEGLSVLALRRRKDTAPAAAPAVAAPAEAAVAASKAKKRRKRRKPLPKNYDPAFKPDPERWIPMSQRSRGRGRRRPGKGAHQGGTVDDKLDKSSAPEVAVKPSEKVVSSSSSAPRNNRRKKRR